MRATQLQKQHREAKEPELRPQTALPDFAHTYILYVRQILMCDCTELDAIFVHKHLKLKTKRKFR